MSLRAAFLPRPLHPGAWWLWALGLATAAIFTTNPLLLLLIVAVTGYVVAARRTSAPWARSYGAFLRLGVVVVLLRLAFQVVFGATGTGTVIVHIPELPLPDWAGGVQIGGDLTVQDLLGGPLRRDAAGDAARSASARRTRWRTRRGCCGACPPRCTRWASPWSWR